MTKVVVAACLALFALAIWLDHRDAEECERQGGRWEVTGWALVLVSKPDGSGNVEPQMQPVTGCVK